MANAMIKGPIDQFSFYYDFQENNFPESEFEAFEIASSRQERRNDHSTT